MITVGERRIDPQGRLVEVLSVVVHYAGEGVNMSTSAENFAEFEKVEEGAKKMSECPICSKVWELLRTAMQNCPCSLRERESGHRTDCWTLEIDETLLAAIPIAGESLECECQPCPNCKGVELGELSCSTCGNTGIDNGDCAIHPNLMGGAGDQREESK